MFTEECINTFLENQEQLFPQAVAESYDEAGINPYSDVLDEKRYRELFGKNIHPFTGVDYVEYYSEVIREAGADVEGMSDEELEDASEVFALPDGKYLIVEG